MDIRIVEDARDIDSGQWSGLSGDPYESREWFMANQDYFKGTRFYYICAYDNNTLKAMLPAYDTPSIFNENPFGFYYGRFKSSAKKLRHLISGSPASKTSDVIGDLSCESALNGALIDLAQRGSKEAVCFPYTRECIEKGNERISECEYVLSLPGSSMEDYLSSLPRKRRVSIKHEISSCADVEFEDHPLAGYEGQMKRLHDATCDKYANVYLKAIPKDFYACLSRHMKESSRICLAKKDGQVKGALLYLLGGDRISAFHVGVPSKDFIYFNLVYYNIISKAYEGDIRMIHYAGSADEAKMARGCVAVKRYISIVPLTPKVKAFVAVLKTGQRSLKRIRRLKRPK